MTGQRGRQRHRAQHHVEIEKAPTSQQRFPARWDEERYLHENPDVRVALSRANPGDPMSGYEHFIRYGIVEGRSPMWTGTLLDAAPQARANLSSAYRHWGLPAWAVREATEQAQFEAALDPEATADVPAYDPFNKDAWGKALGDLCSSLRHREYDYLFFLPWLKQGGADLAAIFHISAAARVSSRVAVALTEDADSPWLSRLPDTIDVLHFGKFLKQVPLEFQALCCYILIVALSAGKAHVINSHAAWTLLTERSRAVSKVCKLYVSLYCYDRTASGEPVGYARNIRRCAPDLTRVFTDNSVFAAHLIGQIGLFPDKVVTLRHPVSQVVDLPDPLPHSGRILWAGRLDQQKRPELLVRIAKRLPALQFDVHGSAVLSEAEPILEQFMSCPNITYHGSFDDTGAILTGQHRLFLYTSAWDGLPNILLEAMNSGMLVVTAAVGGIENDLGSEHCILVHDHGDPEAYVCAIAAVYRDPLHAEATRIAGRNFVRTMHTNNRFVQQLRSAGYLEVKPRPRASPQHTGMNGKLTAARPAGQITIAPAKARTIVGPTVARRIRTKIMRTPA